MTGGTTDLIVRLKEWATWYQYRKNDPRSVEQQVAFNNTMIDGCMELLALCINEILKMKGRQLDGNVLWTPRDLRVTRTEAEEQRLEDHFHGRSNGH